MKEFRVNKDTLPFILSEVGKMPLDNTMKISFKKNVSNRTLAQNRLTHLHYSQMGLQMGESALESKTRCKLDYGIPILISESEAFAMTWAPVKKYMDREEQLRLAETIDVTSTLNKAQMRDYITNYMMDHAKNGVILAHPEDLFYEAIQ